MRLTRLFAKGFHVACACVRVQVGAHAEVNGTHFSVCKNHAGVSWSAYVCLRASVCVGNGQILRRVRRAKRCPGSLPPCPDIAVC